MIIAPGATSRSITVYAYNATTGLPYETAAFNDAGIALWYRRGATGAKTAITPATLSALTDAWSSGGFKAVDENAIRLDLPDAAIAAGVTEVEVGGAATAWVLIPMTIQLETPQTGDSFARLGASGAGLTALGDTRLANLDAAMSTRATPAQVNTEADTALSDAGVTSARMAYLTGPIATAAKLLSYFQSALRKDVTVDTDIGGTYDDATDSLEALSESLAGATVYATGSTPNTDADLYIRRGDTVAVTIGDLTGLAAGWDVLWVTIKRSEHDADSAAILQVRLNVATPTLPGLIYINGQTPTDAGCAATDAWISDVDAGADTLVLNIKPAASLLLPARGQLWFDVQQLDGTTVTSLATGEKTAEIGADITRATS